MTALSVVLTTYNKPRELERALEGFRHQTFRDFEVLVCDDGSGPETRALIEAFAASAAFPVRHVWQPDDGFRAARSRNNGGREAAGHTLVFVDGDCVPDREFLAKHLELGAEGAFLAGERWLYEQDEAEQVTLASIASGQAFAEVPRRERKRLRSIRWKDRWYVASGTKPDRPRLMTCNASVPLALFRAVNGLDERYVGWGQEDEDLRRRLVMRGFQPKSAIGLANCIHLWHPADPSFLGKRKAQPNWIYYGRGFHLSRCRRGLVERPLSDLAGRVTGPDADLVATVEAALGLGAAAEPLEVEVVVDPGTGTPPRPSGRAEVTVWVGLATPTAERARGSQLVIGPGLAPAGGALPGEVQPELDKAWTKTGARALRPLAAPLDDPAGPAALRDLLDELL